MQSIVGLDPHYWKPLTYFCVTNSFAFINSETIINTWIAMVMMFVTLLIARLFFSAKKSVTYYLIASFVESFMDLTKQTLGSFQYYPFAMVVSLFIFILFCNWISLIPFREEPTSDLNTTLALAMIAFFYKEVQAIKAIGFIGYLKEFLHPFFVMFPINVVGHFSKLISMSFRLYGNIYGGAIISQIYTNAIAGSLLWETFGLLTGFNFLIIAFFTLFEGFIQAFVFAMLTLTYLAIAIQAGQQEVPDV